MKSNAISRRNREAILIAAFFSCMFLVIKADPSVIVPIFILATMIFIAARKWISENFTIIDLPYQYKMLALYAVLTICILQAYTFTVIGGLVSVFGDAAYTAGHRLGAAVSSLV